MPKSSKSSSKNQPHRLNSLVTLAIAIVVVLLAVSLVRGVTKAQKALNTINEAKLDNDLLQQDIKELQHELEYVNSEQFIESQLRDGLGMAQKGDVVVVLPDEEYIKSLNPELEVKEEERQAPIWQKWLDLFI